MSVAACDILGFLPSPVSKHTESVCQLFEGQLLAYALNSAVVIVDVRQLQQAAVLAGPYRSSVTALSWCPEQHTRDPKSYSHVKLAAGDNDGKIFVWDVHGVAPIAGIEDPWLAALGRRADSSSKAGGVLALAWVLCNPCSLAIALPGLFLIWDTKGGGVLWKKELSAEVYVTSIQVDPYDCRHICLCGNKGNLILMRFLDLARERVESQTYKVDVSGNKCTTFKCTFPASANILFVLLPREIVVFDLEYGQPAASSALGSSRPNFKEILGCYGHATLGVDTCSPGIDLLFCSHEDGSISTWRRRSEVLMYELMGHHSLLPPPSRINNNQTARLMYCCAAPWRQTYSCARRAALPLIPAELHMGHSGSNADFKSGNDKSEPALTMKKETKVGAEIDSGSKVMEAYPTSLLVVCVTDSGQICLWDAHLPQFLADGPPAILLQKLQASSKSGSAKRDTMAAKYPAPKSRGKPRRPKLLGMLHSLAHSVTTVCACPSPLTVSTQDAEAGGPQVVGLLAAVTVGGNVELISLQQGLLTPLQPHVAVSLGAHKDFVRGVRWLGSTARVASFSCEKGSNGYHNSLLLTDVRNRASVAFRDVAAESAAMLGIRASPLGRYLLVLLRGAPSEIWLVGGLSRPSRVRVLDLPFTAVEWVIPREAQEPLEAMAPPPKSFWQRSPMSKERSLSGYSWEDLEGSGDSQDPIELEEQPEEKLAFSLADGRVGVLSVKGRKVTDTKPKRPVWGMLNGSPDSLPTAVAAWGHIVILGHEDGSLSRWDTRNGRTTSLATTQGTVRRMHFAAPASQDLEEGPGAANARIAVLFSSGSFGVWELDGSNELRQGVVTPASTVKFGKVVDLSWAPLPPPVGLGSVLAIALEDGSLAFVDAVQTTQQPSQRRRMAAFRGLLSGSLPSHPLQVRLPPATPHGSSLLLANSWRLLLSILLRSGIPAKTLKAYCKLRTRHGHERPDDLALWRYLPLQAKSDWDRSAHRVSSAEAQDLSMLAGDREMRTLIQQRTASFAAKPVEQGHIERQEDVAEESPKSATEIPAEDQQAALKQDSLGTTAVLQSVPKGTAFGSLKARMSKLAKAGTAAMREGGKGSLEGMDPSGSLARIRISADQADAHEPAPLGVLLTALASMRADGNLLFPSEWAAYEAAVQSGSCAERMAVAAEVTSSYSEAAFWRSLPYTLLSLRSSLPQSFSQPASSLVLYTDPQTGISAYRRSIDGNDARQSGQESADMQSQQPVEASGNGKESLSSNDNPALANECWSEVLQLADAKERIAWHERMSSASIEQSEALQEKRVLEYIALGDYQTAVGFLLASNPERSARYYRDALCTMALAAASAGGQQAVSSQGAAESVSRTLQIQAAKVVTAHAASVGDPLIGVPLLCSAGLHLEAAGVLQDSGLWQCAATLVAQALPRPQQAGALERWAIHMHQAEGGLWRAVGILTAAGSLRNAVLHLRREGLPDAAAAYVEAANAAGFGSQSIASDSGGLENWHHTGSTPTRRSLSGLAETRDAVSIASEFERYCTETLKHL